MIVLFCSTVGLFICVLLLCYYCRRLCRALDLTRWQLSRAQRVIDHQARREQAEWEDWQAKR